MTVKIQVEFFWIVTPCDVVGYRNVGVPPQHYTASQSRRVGLDKRCLIQNEPAYLPQA